MGRSGSCGACAAPSWLPAAAAVRRHRAGAAGTAAFRQAASALACGHRGILRSTAGSDQCNEGAAHSTGHDSRAEFAGWRHCSRPHGGFAAVCTAGSNRGSRLRSAQQHSHRPQARRQHDSFKSKQQTGCYRQVRHMAHSTSGALPAGQMLRTITHACCSCRRRRATCDAAWALALAVLAAVLHPACAMMLAFAGCTSAIRSKVTRRYVAWMFDCLFAATLVPAAAPRVRRCRDHRLLNSNLFRCCCRDLTHSICANSGSCGSSCSAP